MKDIDFNPLSVSTGNRMSIFDLKKRKGGIPIVCVSLYDFYMARLCDPYVDMILVGDSLGMVVCGDQDTLDVTVSQIISHARGVVRAANSAIVVVDMPFGSFESSPETAFASASRIMNDTHCDAVKLECTSDMVPQVEMLVSRGIPVVAHIGMLPQSAGGERGSFTPIVDIESYGVIYDTAIAVQNAGACAIVVEAVAEEFAINIVNACSIPIIGIGASPKCDGQILVAHDLLGLTEAPMRFVKKYADLANDVRNAIQEYASDVVTGRFPSSENTYKVKY